MTPGTLRVLIAAGETLAVEFKGEERAPLNDRDLLARLVGRGELVMLGATKGAFHERPPKDLDGSKSDRVAPNDAAPASGKTT